MYEKGKFLKHQNVRDPIPNYLSYGFPDVDECVEIPGVCSEEDHICVNMQGSFICHKSHNLTDCPSGFKFQSELNKCIGIMKILLTLFKFVLISKSSY